ncbi:hypothetical protein BGW38_005811 [Lunasporangiospora selenospora]|uniref:Uncharacterized protein n=1 Tax=Lunasporangiospora selenospora TaxID=979761 RepID=A0A9P6FMX9_9FUNG|nr:hypothetical protein BGW38_005811 [Lunasporangiospora selenospora]
MAGYAHHPPPFQQPIRHLQDLDLISSWEQAAHDPSVSATHPFMTQSSSTYLSEALFDSASAAANMSSMTTAELSTIEEQQNLKEAQLAEEREQLRRQAGPNGVASMLAPSLAIVSEPARPRLRVPGLDHASDRASVGTQLDVDKFMHICQQTETPSMQLSHPSESRKPLRVENRFMSLVSDLQLAGQMYYPGASLPTFPELSDLCSVATTTTMTEPCQPTIPTENAWAQEFATERPTSIPANRTAQQYLGAEWNWEKLFGKDPRRTSSKATLAGQTQEQWDLQQKQQLHSGAASSTLSSAVHLEHERLKAVALTRLQALFGHLSLGRPDSLPS